MGHYGKLGRFAVTRNGTVYYDHVVNVVSKPVFYQKGVLQMEVSAFYGGESLSKDQKIVVYRVANGVPLLYQSSACAITKTLVEYNWKKVGFTQIENQLPRGKLILFVHINSTKVPFITESKDAIAGLEVVKETLCECLDKLCRSLKVYMKKEIFYSSLVEKKQIITKVVPTLLSVLKKGLKRTEDILSDLEIEKLKANILKLLCLYVDPEKQQIRIYNTSEHLKSFKVLYKDLEPLTLTLKPEETITIDLKGDFRLDEITPVQYVILDHGF